MSLVIVMPAYNAGRHLRALAARIARVADVDLTRIVVVNDGSTDDTREQILSLGAVDARFELVDRRANGGYGAAMKDGLDRARLSRPEMVACVHADGQYSPEALPRLAHAMRARRLDILQGSRIASGTALSGGMPVYKYIANAALNRLENRTFDLQMTDYHSGYLFYGRRALEMLPLRTFSDSFDFDLEVIASARAHGLSVGESPVPTHYGDETSYLNPAKYGLRVLRVMWNYRRGHYDPT
jgi:glycosyltransferase involved in cell wall biosynthesis